MKKITFLSKGSVKLVPFYVFFTILIIAISNNSFFWDKDIIISKRAFWFYENNFSLILPNTLDGGYAPVLGMMLALLWKIFGISLRVGHYLMLPIIIGLIYQLYTFMKYFFTNEKYILLSLILIVIDTTLLSQAVVVSSDLVLIFFFFLSLNSILGEKRNILIIALIGLSLSHFRGVMSCFIVFIFDYYFYKTNSKKNYFSSFFSIIPQYLPAVAIYLCYLIYHYITTGWNLKHEASPWIGCFETVNFTGFLRNILIVIWRLVDFGRLFFWICGIYFLTLFLKKKIRFDEKIKILIILMLLALMINLPSMLLYKVLAGHRYLMIIFILLTILITYILFEKISNKKLSRFIYLALIIGLLSGYFWIYPDKIAKGWDSTIAHMPYYNLRKKMINYIDTEGIPFNEIGSEVPNITEFKFIDLNNDDRIFLLKDFTAHKYIFYSNIYNMFTDEEIDILKNKWLVEKEFRCLNVYVRLYRNPNIKNSS